MNAMKSYLNRLSVEWMMYMVYKWSCIQAFFVEMVTRVMSTPMPMYVYKVMTYDHMGEADCTEYYYKGLSIPHVLPSSDEEPTDDHRIEYRITWSRNKKYRIVSTLSNPLYPQHEMFVGTGMLSSKPKAICAILKDEDGECNVIERVYKYAGPKHDYFGQSEFKMKWMFENDELKETTVLSVLFSNGTHKTYGIDDIIN